MTRIGIDCRLAGQEHAGIGRYTQNLVQRLVLNKDINWVLFFSNSTQAREILPQKLDHVKEVITPIRHYSLLEQIKLPLIFAKEKLDLLHVPHFNVPIFYQGKIVVTIHDLLWHEQRGSHVTTLPAWKYRLKYWGYTETVKKAVEKAAKIFVPSTTVAATLAKYYPKAKDKTIVTYEGVEQTYLDHEIKEKPRKKQLVYTGSLYPHKNIKVVFQALQKLPDFSLKLVGSRNVFQDNTKTLVKNYKLTNQVEFLGKLSDKDLIKLYEESFALVFPSFSEGFGLPGLEAMAVGLSVIASDIPIFREIYKNAAAYFNPLSSAELLETIHALNSSRKFLTKAGKDRVKSFSWDKMTDKTFKIYQQVLKQNHA